MIFMLHPSLKVQRDDALSYLRLGWAGGKHSPALRDAALRFIDLIDQLSSQRVLIDMNTMYDLPVYEQLWMTATLLPRTLRLPVQQVVVVLPDQRTYNRQVMEFLMRQFQNARQLLGYAPCDIQFFAQPDEALEWLTDHSPRAAELQAEWEQSGAGLSESTRQYAQY